MATAAAYSFRSSLDHFGIYAKGREKERQSRDPVLIGGAVPRTRRTRRTYVMSTALVMPAATTLRLRLPSRSALQYNLESKNHAAVCGVNTGERRVAA